MAARQTSVSEPVSGVHVSRSREEDRSPWRVAADPGLWSTELDWLLNCAASALGDRGTLSAVIAAIERGGSRSSVSYDQHTDEQVAWLRPREWGTVHRARRLQAVWHRLRLNHRAVLVAHYLNGGRCSSKVHARFGVLSGVAAALWCDDIKSRRHASFNTKVAQLEAEREDLVAELGWKRIGRTALELQLARARDALPPDGARIFRLASRLRFQAVMLRRLESRHGEVMRNIAEVAATASRVDAMGLLDKACERGELPGLRRLAESMVREAHRAWNKAREAVEAEEL